MFIKHSPELASYISTNVVTESTILGILYQP